MIEALSGWIQTLVLLLLFVAFLQLLLPDHPLRDYTRVVLGLVIIAAVLGPLLGILDVPTWEQAAQSALAALESGGPGGREMPSRADPELWIARGSALAQRAQGRVREEVRRRMDAQVRSLVLLIPGVREAAVSSRWDSEGNLQRVHVDLWMLPQGAPGSGSPPGTLEEGWDGNSDGPERVRAVISQFFALPAWRVDVQVRDGG